MSTSLHADEELPFLQQDWDFADSRPEPDVHPYPCRFIPEIPGAALDLLAPDGPVLDPFCGSGTTLVEALRRGHDAVGVDLNPIACLISRVKTTPWQTDDALQISHHADNLRNAALDGSQSDLTVMRDHIPALDHWFDEWAQELLAGAIAYLGTLSPNDPWRDRVALAISASVVRIGRQESDTRYAAVDKPTGRGEGVTYLLSSLNSVSDWLMSQQPPMNGRTSRIECGDARDLSWLPESSIGSAIFSPPYPNAYEYWLYHKYRMYWLGFDPIAVRAEEIGARPHYSRPNGLTEDDFAKQMTEVFNTMSRVLRPDAPVVVVVGDSLIRGTFVDNGDLLADVGTSCGYRLAASTTRDIRRSSFNQAHSRARSGEHLLLFKAPST